MSIFVSSPSPVYICGGNLLTLVKTKPHKVICKTCPPKWPSKADKLEEAVRKPAHLQKADGQQSETVRADAASEHLIHVPLQQELLQNQHQVLQRRVLLQEFLHTPYIAQLLSSTTHQSTCSKSTGYFTE